MKFVKAFLLFLMTSLVLIACQNENEVILDAIVSGDQEQTPYLVPEIPAELARLMTEEQRTRFLAGPGEEFLRRAAVENEADPLARKKRARWHPVLMSLGYNLQIYPIGGDCQGTFYPCFGPNFPNGYNPLCFPNGPSLPPFAITGATGQTSADGFWFSKAVHAEYFPVFCGQSYAGYGEGFYMVEGDRLNLVATNTPHTTLANGDSYFLRHGTYVGNPQGGSFANAFGWELSYMFTSAANSPSNTGTGFSNVITVGWVYY